MEGIRAGMTDYRPVPKVDIHNELKRYSMEPFIQTLAYLLGCMPTKEAVQEFANAHPDRWANSISTFSKMAGYHDKLEIEHNIHLDMTRLGDAELDQRLLELREVKDITPLVPGVDINEDDPDNAVP